MREFFAPVQKAPNSTPPARTPAIIPKVVHLGAGLGWALSSTGSRKPPAIIPKVVHLGAGAGAGHHPQSCTFERAAPSAADPEKKNNVAFEFEL